MIWDLHFTTPLLNSKGESGTRLMYLQDDSIIAICMQQKLHISLIVLAKSIVVMHRLSTLSATFLDIGISNNLADYFY